MYGPLNKLNYTKHSERNPSYTNDMWVNTYFMPYYLLLLLLFIRS